MAKENKKTCNLAVSRRRGNLFKKAKELSTLCGAHVAVVTISKRGKLFVLPGSDSVIKIYNEYKKSSPPDTRLVISRERKSPETTEDDDVIEREIEVMNNLAETEASLNESLPDMEGPKELSGPYLISAVSSCKRITIDSTDAVHGWVMDKRGTAAFLCIWNYRPTLISNCPKNLPRPHHYHHNILMLFFKLDSFALSKTLLADSRDEKSLRSLATNALANTILGWL
ncbi:hypothetical protein V6N13_106047 [Hibiscus sabdariffa]|uniref:MADS-box domain-containing protein n=1 Tax=Hibiscus sabdariffa TaxID=183260 RepID=A0ABR2EZI8_9ROSI